MLWNGRFRPVMDFANGPHQRARSVTSGHRGSGFSDIIGPHPPAADPTSMIDASRHSLLAIAVIAVLELAVIGRILLRPNRDPASRIAWIVVVAALPLIGMLTYLFLGETDIGRRRVARLQAALARLPPTDGPCLRPPESPEPAVPERFRHVFRLGHSISGFEPVVGNKAALMADSNAAIDAMVTDIDAATDHVHLLFYIWLPDNNGRKVVEALKRAAARGIVCRA